MKKKFIHYSEGDLYVSSMLGEEPEYIRNQRARAGITANELYDVASVHFARASTNRSCVGCVHVKDCAKKPFLLQIALTIAVVDTSSLRKQGGFKRDSNIRTQIDTKADKGKRDSDYAKRYLERFVPHSNGTAIPTEQDAI